MRAGKLLMQITAYYLIIGFVDVHRAEDVAGAARLSPDRRGRAADHPAGQEPAAGERSGARRACRATSGRACSGWWSRSSRAILVSLPVSWVYMAVRGGEEYDQSLVNTIIVLPMVVTGIVIIVQNSPGAGLLRWRGSPGAVRFRNSLKSSGDALFILLAVGIGLSRRHRRDRARRGDQHRVQLLLRDAVDHRIWRARGHEALPRRL